MKTRLFSLLFACATTLFALGCIEDERPEQKDYLCDTRTCENGAGCRSDDGVPVCICLPGFSGERCEIPDPGPCDSNPCENEGTCAVEDDTAVCACPEGVLGERCENDTRLHCDPSPCVNGTCSSNGTGPVCACDDGYTGELCDTWEDLCSPNPCLNGGTCSQNSALTYSCFCTAPYHGSDCQNCGRLCSESVDYYRGRFIYCLDNAIGSCTSWMACYGEIEINSHGYGTVHGTSDAQCFE